MTDNERSGLTQADLEEFHERLHAAIQAGESADPASDRVRRLRAWSDWVAARFRKSNDGEAKVGEGGMKDIYGKEELLKKMREMVPVIE